MNTRTAHLLVDTATISPTALLRRTAEAGAVVGLTHRMLRDLERELGGMEAAVAWLLELATLAGRPVFINVPNGPDAGQTIALAPPSWSQERLAGFVGGLSEGLEELFGKAELRDFEKSVRPRPGDAR